MNGQRACSNGNKPGEISKGISLRFSHIPVSSEKNTSCLLFFGYREDTSHTRVLDSASEEGQKVFPRFSGPASGQKNGGKVRKTFLLLLLLSVKVAYFGVAYPEPQHQDGVCMQSHVTL